MKSFGALKRALRGFYGRYSLPLDILFRTLAALAVGFALRDAAGYNEVLSNPLLLIVIGVLAGLLPFSFLPPLGAVMLSVHAFTLDLTAGGVTVTVLLLLLLLFLRFVPEEAPAAALTPVAMYAGFAPLPAMLCGLRRGPASLPAVGSGAVIGSLVRALGSAGPVMREMEESAYLDKLRLLVRAVFSEELAVTVIAMVACLTLVYAVRCLSADYAPYLGIVLGGLIYLLFLLLSRLVLKTDLNLPLEALGIAASVAAALLFLAVTLPLAYRRSEYLRFEDDAYYYYVKAIPKAEGTDRPGEAGELRTVLPDAPSLRPEIDDEELARKLEESLRDL